MSSDEDFSLVSEKGEESPVFAMEAAKMEIVKCKVTYDMMVTDQRDLTKARDEQLHLTEEYEKRIAKLRQTMEAEEQDRTQRVEDGKAKLAAAEEEERRLQELLLSMQAELRHLDQEAVHLRQQAQESSSMPEKKLVFHGVEGTALITFEDEAVAQNIVRVKQHEIKLGDCCISLEASPVLIWMPSQVEVTTGLCSRRVLVSDLPRGVEQSRLLDRLEIHFAKRRNLGGEVDGAEMLHDSGNAVLTFVEDTVAKGLTDRQYHEVDFGDGTRSRVKLSPFLSGEITDLQTRVSASARTVLLRGIPAIMDPSDLQDQLEIHFQKKGNGGGEVEAIAYNPLRRRALAVFEDDCPAEAE
ncbi:hypothetical protein ANANG_G00296540 [Anguilla anguilla]|uniref:NID domain-containing protein n=1 Tax=Anguilla anguilla TaxID=7936 RepID=A0A9D3LMD0_ANGAN|nr:hypothetical protein ANANG_G00296540 [Anguilla anguilla]